MRARPPQRSAREIVASRVAHEPFALARASTPHSLASRRKRLRGLLLALTSRPAARIHIWIHERRIGAAAVMAFDAYFREIVERRRTDPRDDILSALIKAEHQGERLSEREMLNMQIIAGTETTSNLIGKGILALLRHPAELEGLREDPGPIPSTVEELMHYDSPGQASLRRMVVDCEANGFGLRERDNVVVLIGVATTFDFLGFTLVWGRRVLIGA